MWDIPAEKHKPGRVIHTQGWPLTDAWGGGFLYHQENNQVALGFVVALDYSNPYLSPFEEMQRWKTHPAIRAEIEGGRRVSYGARAINEGGYQAIPKLVFPGRRADRLLGGFRERAADQGHAHRDEVGDAGRRSGVRGDRRRTGRATCSRPIPTALHDSWIAKELQDGPQRPAGGRALGRHSRDALRRARHVAESARDRRAVDAEAQARPHARSSARKRRAPIDYPKPDGVLTFDRLSSVFVSNTNHEEDQPVHLTLKDADIPTAINLPVYAGPEQRYCPAGVYEFVDGENGEPRLQINAQNCVHCKTCDIKDPTQNINWVTPEGGGGPNYPNM